MRQIIKQQRVFGQVDIAEITFDHRSRDEIPKLLRGLQYIYCTEEIREQVFTILRRIIPDNVTTRTGRPGMDMWKILVLGVIRLNCNWNYDKLQEIVNNHKTLRKMLGHGLIDEDYYYPLQTLKDNVSLLTVEVLAEINQVVVTAGHKLITKKNDGPDSSPELMGRCDSFVLETNVHFPTDINLLWDAVRKSIMLVARACESVDLSQWRQHRYHLRKVKKQFHIVRRMRHSTSGQSGKNAEQEQRLTDAYRDYCDLASSILHHVEATVSLLEHYGVDEKVLGKITRFVGHGRRLLDQIDRRAIHGEVIPHTEKLFSVFEEHTEWISKGKAGVQQELGKRVCIVEDQCGFVLHGQVMDRLTDEKVAVDVIRRIKARYPHFTGCSFDKGFWSPSNREQLEAILDKVVLPKKGRCSRSDAEREHSPWFVAGKRQHSAVESAINALENHGLDRCPDRGMVGFCRYVSLSILARNIQKIGHILQVRDQRRRKRIERYHQTQLERKMCRAA